ncbi:hypothetical protein RRG08_001228 [Elysia crispata]|uniref:DDE-1 domain-containing protein n=1 Tax=Elysia crispata TaxID=231223 RepID=A0AAE1B859_9GAST|nr:hypothetical protein RRG08_001228 [Elysia crispata]
MVQRRFSQELWTNKTPAVLMDSHSSHEVLELLELAREENIHILALPHHTTQILQPLDTNVFKPFKSLYDKSCSEFLFSNPSKVIDKQSFPLMLSKAWEVMRDEALIKKHLPPQAYFLQTLLRFQKTLFASSSTRSATSTISTAFTVTRSAFTVTRSAVSHQSCHSHQISLYSHQSCHHMISLYNRQSCHSDMINLIHKHRNRHCHVINIIHHHYSCICHQTNLFSTKKKI